MGRIVGIGLWELVSELSKELLAGALKTADAALVCNLNPAESLPKQVRKGVMELPDAAVFDARHGF